VSVKPIFEYSGFGFAAPAAHAAEFSQAALAAGANITRNEQWHVEMDRIEGPSGLISLMPPEGALAFAVFGQHGALPGSTIAYRLGESFIWIGVGMWELSFTVQSPSGEEAERALGALRAAFPPYTAPSSPDKPTSHIKFWMLTNSGPTSMGRTLDVVNWDAVRPNYPRSVSEQLDRLMAFTPKRSGQIVLFYGPPGTGKTFAIRALAWAWREWCSLHYIMDVPTFLSSTPEYMNTLLFAGEKPGNISTLSVSPSDETVFFPDEDGELFTMPTAKASPAKWRLIVLEDSGELLAENAREQTGAAMARLLNAADGLLGQGARVMFLITTNEPLDKLHPAVARPGRCVAHLNFAKFDHQEASEWVKAQEEAPQDVIVPPGGGTLAELYALLEERQQIVAVERKKTPFGFKAA
jgi:hypothetical protein